MPAFEKLDRDELKRLREEQGLSKETLKKRANVITSFKDFLLKQDGLSYDGCLNNNDLLEDSICKFLLQQRLDDKKKDCLSLPKKKTLEAYKSHLRCQILKDTLGTVDIGSRFQFKNFNDVYQDILMKLKKEGLGDTEHFESMPDSSVSAVFSLLSLVFQLMTTEKTSQQYQSYVNVLPLNFRESYHRLMQ